jgi:hypothetical protein
MTGGPSPRTGSPHDEGRRSLEADDRRVELLRELAAAGRLGCPEVLDYKKKLLEYATGTLMDLCLRRGGAGLRRKLRELNVEESLPDDWSVDEWRDVVVEAVTTSRGTASR